MHNLLSKMARIEALCKSVFASQIDQAGNRYRYPRLPKMPDCQVIALWLTAILEGIHSENALFAHLAARHPALLAGLCSRQRFNQRIKRLRDWCDELSCHLCNELAGPDQVHKNTFIVDSTPLPICRFARAGRVKICQEQLGQAATYGYSACDKSHYLGFKLHLCCNTDGVVDNYFITPANEADVSCLQDLAYCLPAGCDLLGDKGFICRSLQLDLFEKRQIALSTPLRANMKPLPEPGFAWTKAKGRMRKRIETLFSQLKDQFRIALNYAKTARGLFTRLSYKICALTLRQFQNHLEGLPLGHLKNTYPG